MFNKIHLSDHVYYIINLLSYLPSPYVDSEIHYIIKSKYGTENEW